MLDSAHSHNKFIIPLPQTVVEFPFRKSPAGVVGPIQTTHAVMIYYGRWLGRYPSSDNGGGVTMHQALVRR
jgi:hypothetical protein